MKVYFKKHSKSGRYILNYNCADGVLPYYTGEKGEDKSTQSTLKRLELAVDQMAADYRIKGVPLTKAILKARLDQVSNKRAKAGKTMFDQMSRVIDAMQDGKIVIPKSKKRYSEGSIKTFRFTVSFLQKFDPNLDLANTDISTYERFIIWCQGKNYSTNYIGSQIKNWVRLGKEIGGTVFDEFKKMSEDAFDVYLDEKELKAIYNLKIENKEMDIVRDWFILDCYTGLRVSDLVILSKQNYSKGYITIANEKTDEKVVIPVHPYVKKIRIKHSGFPAPVSSHDINILIKSVARSAGIDDEVLHTITKGGKRVDTYMKKYQLISCHTARRSFITNLLKNGVPETLVMKLTGIKSFDTLKKYNKLSTEEAAKISGKHSFFK